MIALLLSPFKSAFNASENKVSTFGVFLDLNKEKNRKIITPAKIKQSHKQKNKVQFISSSS